MGDPWSFTSTTLPELGPRVTPFQVQQSRLAVDHLASALFPSFESQQAEQILGVANIRPEGYAVQLNNHRRSTGTLSSAVLCSAVHSMSKMLRLLA